MTTFRPTRRSLLGGAALFVGADLLAIRSESFGDEAGLMIQRLRVGEADVTILSDGTLTFPPTVVLSDEPASEIAQVFSEHGSPQPSFEAQANIPVIRIGDRLIIVDCGGADFMPTLGRFPGALKAAGFSPEDVTDVIFTHGHPDHLWGVIDPLDDSVLFPR
ncbi:MAG: MBL fold metallo-hydrolase, partial [Proteobacteria bacterium]|nr:MBL fold metallo-hydrolase [Pseudomonadota bacterium]